MKFLLSGQGTVAVRASPDEMLPTRGVMQRDLIAFTQTLYQFSVAPPVGPGVGVSPVLMFQSGVCQSGEKRIPIHHLIMFPDGYAITSQDTHAADDVMGDFLPRVDEHFGYRFAHSEIKRLYISQLTVDFDERFLHAADAFTAMQSIINRSLRGPTPLYELKRLTFGYDAVNDISASMLTPTSIEEHMKTDFTIERRVREPFEKNRFYCTAPLPTAEHVRCLEEIEGAIVQTSH